MLKTNNSPMQKLNTIPFSGPAVREVYNNSHNEPFGQTIEEDRYLKYN